MARKPTKARRAPKQTDTIDEAGLTKGELRKLNALRKSIGEKIGEKAFAEWLKTRPKGGPAAERDENAELIAETLGNLVNDGSLQVPRGGYIVTRGRGRVIVTRPKA